MPQQRMDIRMIKRAGPAKLNNPLRVDTAPEGEDIACENWSKYEQKTPPLILPLQIRTRPMRNVAPVVQAELGEAAQPVAA